MLKWREVSYDINITECVVSMCGCVVGSGIPSGVILLPTRPLPGSEDSQPETDRLSPAQPLGGKVSRGTISRWKTQPDSISGRDKTGILRQETHGINEDNRRWKWTRAS